jgi:2-desacetyl-2-hydroxyethyl bacteriochlorophyllide A dehydrogenase
MVEQGGGMSHSSSMRAVRLAGPHQLAVVDVPLPSPSAGEALVELRAAALNHRDVWIKAGAYAALTWPIFPGSDGAGVVVAAGSSSDAAWVGREVVINPSFGWGPRETAQGADFTILGHPRAGTQAQRIVVPVGQLAIKPAHLQWEQAAALPLAGLTAYRALFARAQLQRGERVLVTGIGGGVALFALQFAVAAGADVWVTSSADDKISRAVGLGARGGFNYGKSDWMQQAAAVGGFDVVVDSAGGEGFETLIDLTAAGGRIVFFGATRGNPPVLAMRKVFWRQISILGTTMGSPSDWSAMMAWVAAQRIEPVVSAVFDLEQAAEAYALMERGGQCGKIVLRM